MGGFLPHAPYLAWEGGEPRHFLKPPPATDEICAQFNATAALKADLVAAIDFLNCIKIPPKTKKESIVDFGVTV